MRRHELTDAQWAKIEPFCLGKKGDPGCSAKDNRNFVNAVIYRYKTGIPWRDLPKRFGNFKVVHTRFSRWNKKEVWLKLFQALQGEDFMENLLQEFHNLEHEEHEEHEEPVIKKKLTPTLV